MRLVNQDHIIVGKIIKQSIRGAIRLAEIDVAGIVFDTMALSGFPHHGNIVFGPALDALGLDDFAFFL